MSIQYMGQGWRGTDLQSGNGIPLAIFNSH